MLEFSSSTQIGDRAFTVHFNSSLYPLLEEEHKELGATKASF